MRILSLVALLAAALWLAACSDDEEGPFNGNDITSGEGIRDGSIDTAREGSVADRPAAEAVTGDGPGSDGPSTDGTAGEGTAGEGTAAADSTVTDSFLNFPLCNGKLYACGNNVDDDGDKLVDAADPECTGPCDNDEGSFGLNIPGVNMDPCKQDCYWDNDSGQGNDDCSWTHKCDPKNPSLNFQPPCPYDATYASKPGNCVMTQSATCLSVCVPVTPNGCDCFGCCEIYINGVKYSETVFLGTGPTCTVKTPGSCAPCTQVTSCMATCGPCQLCLGKTIKDLPSWCFGPKDGGPPTDGTTPGDGKPPVTDGKPPVTDGKPPVTDGMVKKDTLPPDMGGPLLPTCPAGVTPCLTNSNCPPSYYCITGCCKLAVF